MRKSVLLSLIGSVLPSLVCAAPHAGDAPPPLDKRQGCEFDSLTSPECWGDYSLTTDWYQEAPDTGVVREYWLEIQNGTAAPDGVERMVLTVNGSIPGPTIFADWGDTLVIHVTNAMENNGTSIHWHGIRQNHTALEDGVASITQCPVAPGETTTYTWRATQYGSTWYHSHFSLQAWNGVLGGIIINGPASAPYNEDKGILVLNDWFHETSDALYAVASSAGPPRPPNGLINGTNVYGDGGSRFQTSVTSGNSYRFRLVNAAMDTHFKFSIDNHNLTVIASDLVPITPYTTDHISIGIGQRYDIIVEANQDAGNYWMRSIPQLTCSTNEMTLNIKGIFNYDSVDVADPETDMWPYDDDCNDELMSNLVPVLPLDAGTDGTEEIFDVGFNVVNGFFKWVLNENTFLSEWGVPTLQKALNSSTEYRADENIVMLNEENSWVYLVIESQLGFTHPIHLHGHDFYLLDQQASATYTDTSTLNFINPPRRDVANLPPGGYLVMGFMTDNPGVWLMHCHIGWHTSQGLALQLVERQSEIAATVDQDALDGTCAAWNTYAATNGIVQEDSGV